MTNDEYNRLVDQMNGIADQAKYIRNNMVTNPDGFEPILVKEINKLREMVAQLPYLEND